MKLFQISLSGETSKSHTSKITPTDISILIQPNMVENMVEILVGESKFHLDMSQLEQKYPDFVAQLKLKSKNDQMFEITDLAPEVFGLMVKYVCEGEKPSKDALEKHAFKLLVAANKYKIDSLKQICDPYLAAGCNPVLPIKDGNKICKSFFYCLEIAIENDSPKLKAKCYCTIEHYYDKFVDNDEWKAMIEKNPSIYPELCSYMHKKHNRFQVMIILFLFFLSLIALIGLFLG